jgi:hypothetical protein
LNFMIEAVSVRRQNKVLFFRSQSENLRNNAEPYEY